MRQLEQAGAARREVTALREPLDELVDDVPGVPADLDDSLGAATERSQSARLIGAEGDADEDDAASYGVVDEIARRVVLTGGRVLAVRRDDLPDRAPVAAILRHRL